MNLAEEIRKISKDLNVTLAELARRSGQSPQNLNKKLNKNTLSFAEFEKLLFCMGVEMSCTFLAPGEDTFVCADERTQSQMNIMEKQLEVERLKNEYFVDMSFELRTALDAILGGLQLIENHINDPKRIRECVEKIMPSARRLVQHVSDNPFNRETGIAGDSLYRDNSENNNEKIDYKEMLQAKRVLLVDDNDLNREIVKELLADSGFATDEAADGKEALTKISESVSGYYDFVLMDIQMPEMNGFESTAEIRKLKDEKKSNIPIIAMTASIIKEDREKARKAGMNGFIEKPLNFRTLLDIMHGL